MGDLFATVAGCLVCGLGINGKVGGRIGLGRLYADAGANGIDQARTETNPRRATHSLQGYRRHWRLRRARWPRDQDLQRSRDRHPRRHHHREAERAAYTSRVLGCSLGRAAQSADEGEWQVWECYCSRRFDLCYSLTHYYHRESKKEEKGNDA